VASGGTACDKTGARRGWAGLWSGVTTWFAELTRAPEPPPAVSIESPRLRLREFEQMDVEAIYAHRSDPEVLRYLGRTHPYSRWEISMAISQTLQQRQQPPRANYQFGIILAEEERLIGECCLGLFYADLTAPAADTATLGFILRREYWGRGYATEAATALLRFAFEELQLHTVEAGCLPENLASRRVLEKLGLVFQGLQEDFPGSPPDTQALVFQLDREQWLTPHRLVDERIREASSDTVAMACERNRP